MNDILIAKRIELYETIVNHCNRCVKCSQNVIYNTNHVCEIYSDLIIEHNRVVEQIQLNFIEGMPSPMTERAEE